MIKSQSKVLKFAKYDLTEEKEFKRTNLINGVPKGFLIMDSFNNPFFPLQRIDIDSAKFSLMDIKQEMKLKNWNGYYLPWHYWVEMVGTDYIAIQTRPINYKSNLIGYENHISICIAGNSHNDIYMKTLYKCLGDIIMSPLHYLTPWKLQAQDTTTLLNLGRAFDEHQLSKFLK